MKLHSKHGHAALMLAVAGAATLGAVKSTFATAFTTTTQTDTLIEAANYPGATRLTAEGTAAAGTTYNDYSLLQFSTAALLPTQTQATSFNSITLNLVDKAETFAVGGLVDVYLSTYTGSPTTLTYQTDAASQPQGIGNGTNPGSLPGTLYSLGQINYVKSSTAGTVYSPSGTSLTLSSAAQAYILSQINAGGILSLVFADDANTVAADFEGSNGTTTLAKPSLVLDVGTAAITSSNSTFTVNGGAKTQTIDLGRIAAAVSSSTTLTLTNSGTNNGTYSVIPGAAGAAGSLVAAGTAAIGTEPVASGGGTSTVTVGINPTTLTPGQPTAAAPATATVVIHDQTNSSDPDITVTVKADQVVASRLIDNAGGTTNVVTYGKVLGGSASAPVSVTLDTENTNSVDFSSNSLTSVTLLANTTVSNLTLAGVSNATLDKDAGSVAAGSSDVLFNDGSVTTTRNVTFTAGTTQGGLYQTDSYYDGYLVIPLQNSDTALNAVTNPTARVYMEADVYQPASVSGLASGYTFSLINAPHTVNKVNSTLGDIGARASAQVTSVALSAQAGWSTSLANGTVLADSATSGGTSGGTAVTAATFDPTNKWNGTYGGTLAVGLQNDQTITGATPNDLGTSNYTLSTVVTGNTAANTSNASVNILPGGSFAGYALPSGSTRNSTVLLLGGTSTNGNTLTLTSFGTPSSAQAASEKATITETGSDTFVLEIYDPAITSASDVLAYTNGSGVNVSAVLGDTGGTASEVTGAYNGSTTLGTYGVDVTGHTVWAVVNHVGSFEAFSQKLGDANGDGKVDLSDLNIVLNNLGTTTSVWAKGNFDGAATIDLTDLNDVLNNLGTSNPVGATAVPEPASIGLAGLGVAGFLLRRRRAAR